MSIESRIDAAAAGMVDANRADLDRRAMDAFTARGASSRGLKPSGFLRAWEMSGLKGKVDDPALPEFSAKIDAALERVEKAESDLFDPSMALDPVTQKPRYQNDIIPPNDPRLQSAAWQMRNQDALQRSAKATLRRDGK